MRFQTPQFIDVEDKIFGPLTIKQFIYVAGGLALSYVFYKFLPFFFAAMFIVPTISLAALLAFYKVNNKPFVIILEAALRFFLNKRLYIWKKIPHLGSGKTKEEAEGVSLYVPKLSNSKLRDLTWSLDIKQSINPAVSKDDKTNT